MESVMSCSPWRERVSGISRRVGVLFYLVGRLSPSAKYPFWWRRSRLRSWDRGTARQGQRCM